LHGRGRPGHARCRTGVDAGAGREKGAGRSGSTIRRECLCDWRLKAREKRKGKRETFFVARYRRSGPFSACPTTIVTWIIACSVTPESLSYRGPNSISATSPVGTATV